jgi:hypothetical protein
MNSWLGMAATLLSGRFTTLFGKGQSKAKVLFLS